MYKKGDVLFVLDFFLALKKKKKKITHNISGNGKKCKSQKKDNLKKKKKLDLIFHILHSLTSGST